VLETIKTVRAHAQAKDPAYGSHGEAQKPVGRTRLRPRRSSEPGHSFAAGGRGQRVAAVAAVCTNLPLIHLSNPTRRPLRAEGPAAPRVGYLSREARWRRETEEVLMEALEGVLVFAHLLGMAAIVGGYFAGLRNVPKRLSAGMVHGTLLQLLTGVLLVGIAEAMGDEPVNHAKVGIKLAIVVVLALITWPRRRDQEIPAGTYHAAGILAITNVAIAVFVK